ncbi:hypothetical protein XE97_24355, partial [Salmonella enterica subsp. enterica serovar Senftenberg]|nr:hypothetical protein [Salmonella enterica subsp. enterica serovar Senftenberg]
LGMAEFASGGLRLRRAALLLFAKDIARWHPGCQVRILRVNGTDLKSGPDYNVISSEEVRGNLLELSRRAWESLRPFLAYATEIGSDARFEQKYIYPEWACREAVINALVHRDYSVNNAVDIFVFDDRIEIKSPGSLLSNITMEQLVELTGVHESRNALIARAMREAGYVQELGEGMKRIFTLMEASALTEPVLVSSEAHFGVTLYHRSVFSAAQQAWLRLFEPWQLTPLQQRVVVAGMNDYELSPADIYRSLNTSDRNIYDEEVTYLRRNALLLETRTNQQASAWASKHRVPKSDAPRFRVINPLLVPPAGRVWIKNIGDGLTGADLERIFGAFGSIVNVRIIQGRGNHR